MYRNLNDVKLL